MGTFVVVGLLLVACGIARVHGGALNRKGAGGKMAMSNGQTGIKQQALSHVPQRCLQRNNRGSCWNNNLPFFFNSKSGNCERFTYSAYSGCGANRFKTHAECTSVCTCALVPETGPCGGHIWRWFYSQADGCCVPFIYGGCGGNSNSYATWTDCSNQCGYPKSGSNWWKWGAEWGKGNNTNTGNAGGNSNRRRGYGERNFMRDWFLSMLLMGGGEGMEIEELASMIAAGHMFGMGGPGSSQTNQGMGGGRAHTPTKPGSFTPLGHVGSAANLMDLSGSSGNAWTRINDGRWDQTTGGAGIGSPFRHDFSSFLTDANGMASHGYGLEGTSFDVFRIIAELSSGELSQLDLNAVAHAFGALDRNGRVDFDLLAQRLVASLISNSGKNNMAALRGVAELLGTVDLDGNINTNMFIRALANAVQRGVQVKSSGNSNSNSNVNPTSSGTTSGSIAGQRKDVTSQGQVNGKPALNTVGLIRQLQAGYLNSQDLDRLAKMFGAINPNGVADIRVLANQMLRSLVAPGSGLRLADLRDLARSFNAFDVNGNINIDILLNALLSALRQLIPQGGQNIAETSAVEMHNIFRRIHSGQMQHNDLVSLAIRYGAREQHGNIDIPLLARRMVNSIQTPTTSRDASLLRFVAQSLGALNNNGNIDVKLFVQGMITALQSVIPGSPNSGWIVGRYRVPGSGGSTAMEVIKIMGNMATGDMKSTDIQQLARKFDAVGPNGKVDINKLARQLVSSLIGGTKSKSASLADLKGVAMSFGALDKNGNINMDQFLKGLTRMFQTGASSSWTIVSSGSHGAKASSGQQRRLV